MKRYIYLALLIIPLTPLHPTEQLQVQKSEVDTIYRKGNRHTWYRKHHTRWLDSMNPFERFFMKHISETFYLLGKSYYNLIHSKDAKESKKKFKEFAKKEYTTQEVTVANTAVLSSMLLMNLSDFLFAGITGSALGTGLLFCLGGAVGAGGAGFGIWWLMNYLNMTWLLPVLASLYASIGTAMGGNFSPMSIGGAVLVGPTTYMLQEHYKGYNKLSALISVYATYQIYYFYQKRYVQAFIKKKVDAKKNKKLIKELSAFQKVKKAILTPIPK